MYCLRKVHDVKNCWCVELFKKYSISNGKDPMANMGYILLITHFFLWVILSDLLIMDLVVSWF